MRIEAPCVVSLTWTLTDAQNQPIDELPSPVEFFSAATTCWPRSRKRWPATKTGDELNLQLEPEHAFGDYKPELVCFETASCSPNSSRPA
jgi:FKBP-type peptidyl-prolyl cis-trans isomerase SlyD